MTPVDAAKKAEPCMQRRYIHTSFSSFSHCDALTVTQPVTLVSRETCFHHHARTALHLTHLKPNKERTIICTVFTTQEAIIHARQLLGLLRDSAIHVKAREETGAQWQRPSSVSQCFINKKTISRARQAVCFLKNKTQQTDLMINTLDRLFQMIIYL